MELKIGDLVKANDQKGKFGVIVSLPVETPAGYTVRVAFDGKVMSMYTWNIESVSSMYTQNKHL